jgi:hypothetical protein
MNPENKVIRDQLQKNIYFKLFFKKQKKKKI